MAWAGLCGLGWSSVERAVLLAGLNLFMVMTTCLDLVANYDEAGGSRRELLDGIDYLRSNKSNPFQVRGCLNLEILERF